MRDLGLIPAKAICAPLSEEHVPGLKVDGESLLLLKGYVEKDPFVGTSGSEDLSDMAASVGWDWTDGTGSLLYNSEIHLYFL